MQKFVVDTKINGLRCAVVKLTLCELRHNHYCLLDRHLLLCVNNWHSYHHFLLLLLHRYTITLRIWRVLLSWVRLLSWVCARNLLVILLFRITHLHLMFLIHHFIHSCRILLCKISHLNFLNVTIVCVHIKFLSHFFYKLY